MSHCIPFPAHAAASTAVAVSWAGRVESAYQWLCHARHTAHPNHPVWHFRWNWNTWKTRLLTHLKSAHPSYRLSPVRRVLTAAGERLECWEPQDSLMLKLLAEHLQPVLLPALSSHCHHLKGRGGIKRAVHHVRQTIETGDYPFVARSDAKGYYANIQHTRLLELLRVHCREAWVLDLASQYCGRTLEQDGYYRTVTKGISLGCPLSPLMGALYLSPLDEAMAALPGIRYTRFMDDWVILARKTEKIARLHEHLSSVALAKEEGASPERIGRDRHHWQKWLHRLIGQPTPAGPTPPGATPVRSLSHHSPQLRFARAGCSHKIIQKYDNENETTGIPRITTLRGGGTRHRGCVRSQCGDGADYVCQQRGE